MPEPDETKRLSCLEVWGGNRFVSTSVALPGMDAWIYSLPVDGQQSVGGGDVHYVSSCAAGALTRLLVADVAGHGAEVSDIARRLRKMMQLHVNFHTQTRFVRALNREFTALAQAHRFATAVAFTYDAPVNKLLVCNAGHPPPMIWHKRELRWSALHSSVGNLPLGIDDVDYEQFEAPIEYGDVVIAFTDALTEARRGDEEFGDTGLLDLLGRIDADDPAKLIGRIIERARLDGWQIGDDLTMLVFRPNGSRQRIAWYQHLLIPCRLVKWIWKLLVS